jgi:VanZ family protein
MKKKIINIIFLIIYVSLITIFFVKSSENGSNSSNSSEIVVNIISNIFHVEKNDNLRLIVRKLIGHFLYNGLIGISSILFYLTFNPFKFRTKVIIHYIIGFIVALISEYVFELNASGRNATFSDVLIDYSGFILFSTIIVIIYIIKNTKKEN